MAAFLFSTASILVVSLILRIAVDELALRWVNGALDATPSLKGS